MFWKYTYAILGLIFALALVAVIQMPDGNLHIVACDVGQGDAVLTTYKNIQIITDGGPDNRVLSCLGRHLPFWDREIELVISTHPDSDHVTGLIEIIRRFEVDKIVINPINSGTQVYGVLQTQVRGRGVSVLNPVAGQSLRVGMIYLDILGPSDSLINPLGSRNNTDKLSGYQKTGGSNLYSIIYKFSFKNFKGLMLGDIPPATSDALAKELSVGQADYIKIPHHGSSTGITDNLLKLVEPKVAVISVGKNNPWGFPSQKILEMLSRNNIQTLRTDELGDAEIVTDGYYFWQR